MLDTAATDSRCRAGLSGENFLARGTYVGLAGNDFRSSCADSIRSHVLVSTAPKSRLAGPSLAKTKLARRFLRFIAARDFPRT
jgi:hypothetical protein